MKMSFALFTTGLGAECCEEAAILFITSRANYSNNGWGLYVYHDVIEGTAYCLAPPIICSSQTMAEPNLHSILASRQLTLDALHLKCSENHLAIIAQSITSWKQLSPFLGLTQQDEDDIQSDNTRNAERKLAMLRRWREKYGDEATYFRLADAFEALKWRNCISKLLDLFQQDASSLSQGSTAPQISIARTVNDQPVSLLGKYL